MYFVPVTPLAGVWIETIAVPCLVTVSCVTPLAGVWIETVFMALRKLSL